MPRRKAKPLPRPQAERRALSARRLLDAATHLIAEQGFSRTTLAQIGEKAGYSRGLVNERFGSKGELVRVLADEFQTYFAHDQLEPALEDKHGLEALLITVDTYLDSVVSSGSLGRAYYELFGESIGLVPEIHATFVAADRSLREGVERTVRSAVRAGEIPRDVDVHGVRRVRRRPLARGRVAVALESLGLRSRRSARRDPPHPRTRIREVTMGEVLGIGTTHVPYLMSAPENLLRFRRMLCGIAESLSGKKFVDPPEALAEMGSDPEAVAREHHRAHWEAFADAAQADRRDEPRRDPPDRRRPGPGVPARQPAAVRDLRGRARSTRRRSTRRACPATPST